MENIKQIASALVKAQSEMSNAVKGSKNPFFKNTYADLNSIREAVLPALNANGITVLQPTFTENGKNYIQTILLHESGEYLKSLTEIIFSKQNDAQAQGSGITYARRYGLQSFICVGADDDDGNKATQLAKPKQDEKRVTPSLTESQFNQVLGLSSEKMNVYFEKFKSGELLLNADQLIELGNAITEKQLLGQ